jgi:hypothetical protein
MFSKSSCCLLSIAPRVYSYRVLSIVPVHQPSRGLKLWITAVSWKNIPGRDILNYQNLEFPPAESCKLQLLSPESIEYKDVKDVDESSRIKTIPSVVDNPSYEEVTLQHVMDNHLHGGMLLARPANQKNPNQYCLQQAEHQETKPYKRPSQYKAGNPASDCKSLNFSPDSDWHFIQDRLEKARSWLGSGYNIEIGVAWSRKKDEIPNQEEMKKLMDRCLHLRPDVIQKGMPAKSMIGIMAQTNWLRYAWVVAPTRKRGEVFEASLLMRNFQRKRNQVAGLNTAGLYEGKRLLLPAKQAKKLL